MDGEQVAVSVGCSGGAAKGLQWRVRGGRCIEDAASGWGLMHRAACSAQNHLADHMLSVQAAGCRLQVLSGREGTGRERIKIRQKGW